MSDNQPSAFEAWGNHDLLRPSVESFGGVTETTINPSTTQGAMALAASMGVEPKRARTVIDAVDKGLFRLNRVSKALKVGSESLAALSPSEGAWNAVSLASSIEQLDQTQVVSMLRDAGVPKRNIASLALECAQILSSRTLRDDALSTESGSFTSGNDEVLPLAAIAGAQGQRLFSSVRYANSNESFGASINKIQSDSRLSILVAVLQQFTSQIDRMFFRVTRESNLVVMKIESGVIFDLEAVDSAPVASNPTRNNSSLYTPIINLHAEPNLVNTTPQKVMENLNPANDQGTVKAIDETSLVSRMALSTANNQEINLFALVRDQTRIGYQNSNHTDLIAEGGRVGSVIVQGTDPNGNTETFEVLTSFRPDSIYDPLANSDDSGETSANLKRVPFIIAPNTVLSTQKTTSIFSSLNTAAVQLVIGFRSDLSLKFGTINGSGSVAATVVPGAGFTNVSAAADIATWNAKIGNYKFSIISYVPHIEFNEENLRKATLGTRLNTMQKQFTIPQSRFVTSDVACDQTQEVESIKTMQTALSVGNSDRGMQVALARLTEMAAFNKVASLNPSLYSAINQTSLSFAATRCRPYALNINLDFENDANLLQVMRESERLTEKHAKVKQILLNALSNVMSKSLYPVNLANGEVPVFRLYTHATTSDLLLSIPEYHDILFQRERVGTANGSDYSFYLDNGFRIDIIRTYFEDWRNTMLIVPVREKDPTDIISFATNQTRGSYAGVVPGVNLNGATAYRAVATDRVIPMVTNPSGVIINIQNLDTDIGNLGVTAA